MSHTILFVDDEERVLQGLRRMLRSMREEWDITFALSGVEALRILEQSDMDVLVSDMRMPGMDGAQLLTRAMELRPETLRIALTGESDISMNLRCVSSAHQYLMKPCDPLMLKTKIARSCALRDQLGHPLLRQLVTGTGTLPSNPESFGQLVEELARSEPRLDVTGQIIGSDMAMTAKTLQLVNSNFFGIGRPVTSPTAATELLGVETLRRLLDAQTFVPASTLASTQLQALWAHAAATQRNARTIATREGWGAEATEQAAVGGLLHDIGLLVLESSPDRELVGASLAGSSAGPIADRLQVAPSISASLLGFWGLPDSIVETISALQVPAATETTTCAMAVQAAATFARETASIDLAACTAVVADPSLSGAFSRWREACAGSLVLS